jgi:TRAP-type C4-dicarboxylate transport system substrate-binding protein
MRPLETRIEVVITDRQLDQDWQVIDLPGTMRDYAKLHRQLDAEMTEALADTQ